MIKLHYIVAEFSARALATALLNIEILIPRHLLEPFSWNGTTTVQEAVLLAPCRVGSVATLSDTVVRVREHKSEVDLWVLLLDPQVFLSIFDC